MKDRMMTFEEWFKEQGPWWHKNTAREELGEQWSNLIKHGLTSDEVASVFDGIVSVMRSEYGD